MPKAKAPTKERAMFMEVLRIEAAKDLVHLNLMDNGPNGFAPEVVDRTTEISLTLPLSQFEPLIDDFLAAFRSKVYRDRRDPPPAGR